MKLRNRVFWRLLIVAWLAIGILMTVLGEWVFACISYVIAAFYLGLELWLWRRSTKMQGAAGEPAGEDHRVGSA